MCPTLPHGDRVEPDPTTDFALMGPHTLLLRRWSRTHLYRSSRSSLSDTALATEICSTSSCCSCSSTVGLSEKERELSTHSHSSCCGYSSFQRNVTGFLSSATVAAQTSHHQRPVFPNRIFGAYYIALGPSSLCQLRALRRSVTRLSLCRFSLLHTQSHSATTLTYESKHHRQHPCCQWRS